MVVTTEIAELTKKRGRIGRYRRRNVKFAHKLLSSLFNPYYFQYKFSNPFASSGFTEIFNHYDSVANQYYLPSYFIALNPGVANGNATTACYYPTNQLVGATDYINVNAINGTLANGSVGPTYQIEFGPTTPGTVQPSMKQRHCWTQIKMLCYGAQSIPVKWSVRIVKFTNNEYNPAWIYFNLLNNRTSERKIVQFYQALNAWAMRSTVDLPKANEKYGQVMKVIKSWGWISNSTQSNEGSNTVGHMKDFKIFFKQDEIQDHNWQTGEQRIAEADLGATGKYPVEVPPIIMPYPNWRNMYFLQVTAQAKYTTSGVPPVAFPLGRPSFDLSVRHRVETCV